MPRYRLYAGPWPPDPRSADADGLVALGGSLEPEPLLAAYRAGLFPWSSRPVLNWWSPDPRAVFDVQTFRPHESLERSIRRGAWRFSVDRDFAGVMRGCAEPKPGRTSTWITPDFMNAYAELHRRGYAHSVEVYEEEELVGGIYGVAVGAFFGGESMFRRRTDASKAALAHLVARLRACGFLLFDGQVPTPHLASLGALPMRKGEFLARLRAAVDAPASLTAP
ncbi:MAG: leucyl/phenylalanyl-tRNA--protein transferase [Planctomycetes bacterium]|nr:leucyl/phenylalanyl-tRNA--protein transferase [Planctomycetota bacterium]